MEKAYSPREIEQRNYQRWEAAGWFQPSGKGTPYCIMIPPPNVTGTLHMGHAFQHSLMDTLTRLHRMDGYNALWQPGTDHAGIATQMVVERQLNADGKNRHDLGREKFLERVWQWKEQSGGTITQQMRRLGESVDWKRDRFTMDEGLSKAVTEVFVKLFEEQLIYRGKRLVNWDPVLHTALSDLEVQSEPEQGFLWHFKYPLFDETGADGTGHLVVATTRPETMLGDTAVAVHPEDERYKHLIGKQIKLPLTDRLIPIIADDYVDREFGSGCVKITPAHDFNDYEMGKRHGLLEFNIFNADAKIIDNNDWIATRQSNAQVKFRSSGLIDMAIDIGIPEKYQGLDRFAARKQIVADVDALGLVEKIEPHTLNVPRGDRSGAVLEPWLTDQWYVRVAPLAGPAIKAVEDGSIKFVPDNWSKTYFQWMHNIQDWCISRQLWWGHRIPAWYDPTGKVYVARSEEEAQQQAIAKHGKRVTLTQDDDVLDTWFSSALWPFSTLGWPEQTAALKTFYPTNVLVTGFDIIFFWVARMIMMGLKFTGEVPFKEVYITGLIRDENGDKMSKSKGNIIDPLDLIDGIDLESLVVKRTTGLMQPHLKDKIEKNTRKQFPEGIPSYGTDALRFTLASLATQGRDIRFDLGRIEGYRNFCNKLWNAARYVLMNTEDHDCSAGGDLSDADHWIKSRLGHTIEQVRNQFTQYRFDLASQALYEFAWYEYCDQYLELCKPVLQSAISTAAQKRGTRHTLLQVFEGYLRLLHPLMPFVTEEIWQSIAPLSGIKIDPARNTIMLQAYPLLADFPRNVEAENNMNPVNYTILAGRQIRGQRDVPPSKKFALFAKVMDDATWARIEANTSVILTCTNTTSLTRVFDESELPPSAMQIVNGISTYAQLAELTDVDAELTLLEKRRIKIVQEIAKCEAKLSNTNFVANAPPAVVEQERERIAAFKAELGQLTEQAQRVASLRKN